MYLLHATNNNNNEVLTFKTLTDAVLFAEMNTENCGVRFYFNSVEMYDKKKMTTTFIIRKKDNK